MVEPNHWTNLIWSVSTPSIVGGWGLPWLPDERREQLLSFFSREEIRNRLQRELETFVASRPSKRLGVYFENLWSFTFTHHPHYELRQRNLPLRDGGRTLGELDFVVRHLPTDSTEHWELAIKFYLQADNDFWVGPGLRDRLDIKLARMRDHQLPVIEQPAAKAILQQEGILIERQWTLMPGRLFRRLADSNQPLDADINPTSHWWAAPGEFRQRFATEAYRWVTLPKEGWLADEGYRILQSCACTALAEMLESGGLHRPLCVAGLVGGRERTRGFIVPDGWYQSALNTLR
ncbi:DUF1853 family protein [Microbulbifer rhizosphaerae]|uniref:DUF1853 domain-containing protein n=1 Tax=Microbulbifer rhizosphaerae TaxID=1562603 RepID=A0A7W4W946_9GAMM|nr:DUF1853 family protein [Microbulbifer rhizosphaerae]MBB3059739.1 hypothetical protein [Microbulbifer rhizosphaerae]